MTILSALIGLAALAVVIGLFYWLGRLVDAIAFEGDADDAECIPLGLLTFGGCIIAGGVLVVSYVFGRWVVSLF